ncbi:hypothetical protein GA0115240_10456 [Streptomyces sp. DvalAA-14]|uniref:hypothetical protein n=1 Tax=unclassified Streptomyces TaxID=2593676 RepID=UPI00081AFD31|nr:MULTISPECIES: hypothetical protein [unclassified Streptomyces]MYS19080.1 hypothetical protein [Streptomyces sp. SID4948]SCD36145.1 hypothetical protein GA0115240_10456 [Streptomyces sp. DvalAA-14]
MIDEEWRGFASAFAEAVRPDDPRGRSGRRMLTIGFAAVLVMALGALVSGALGWGPAAKPSDVRAITPAAGVTGAGGLVIPGAPGSTWTAVAGPTCATSPSGSTTTFTAYGYSTGAGADGTTGWSTSGSGGYTGGGCSGGFLSLPVSGRATAYDSNRFALWTFDFSAKFTSASCRLSTYVPVNASRSVVGGDPAYYYFYGADYALGSKAAPLGGYLVHQAGPQGRWVTNHAFDVTTGKVTLKMVDAGARKGPAAVNAHAAAAQVRLTCRAT